MPFAFAPSRRLIFRSALVGLIACIGLALGVVAVALRLFSPEPAHIGAPPADLAGAETVAIPSRSGSSLRGWWLSGRKGAGAVVLMHGVRSNRLSLVARARVLSQAGYGVLLFDFQAHGESPGQHVTFGRLESLDAAAAVGFVRSRLPDERVAAIGLSLGGAAALLGPTPLAVDALVLEAVYPDIGAAVANRLAAHLGRPAGMVVSAVAAPIWPLALAVFVGVPPDALRPIDRIGGVEVPILIASGVADDRTTIAETRALFDRATEPKRLWEVDGAGHVDLERRDPEAYWRMVLPFLSAALRPNAPPLQSSR
ncbi:alpha/beta hydrolase [Hansschlegelia sp. KR7-227]|uniref:alpha/beta hydrolase n=1 Tax=Hansschlegelia sp. KR7-227 TaxID=3400914 RepID=UPI003BFFADF9